MQFSVGKWFKKWRGTVLAFCVSALSIEYLVKRGAVFEEIIVYCAVLWVASLILDVRSL